GGDGEAPLEGAGGAAARAEDRGRDGARDRPLEAAPGGIRLQPPRREGDGRDGACTKEARRQARRHRAAGRGGMIPRPALAFLLALAGCSLAEPIARQAIDYNATIETAANTLLIRNVLRARDNAPLHFTSLPQIRGSLSAGLTQPGL